MNAESNEDLKMKQGFLRRQSVRQLLLSISILVFCILYMLMPGNQTWLKNRIYPYFKDLKTQLQNRDIEYRRASRYSTYYTYTKKISEDFKKIKQSSDSTLYLLMPTSQYFKRNGILYDVPDPVTFYYFSGVKIVQSNNPDTAKAKCFLHIQDKAFSVRYFQNNSERSDSLVTFRQ